MKIKLHRRTYTVTLSHYDAEIRKIDKPSKSGHTHTIHIDGERVGFLAPTKTQKNKYKVSLLYDYKCKDRYIVIEP